MEEGRLICDASTWRRMLVRNRYEKPSPRRCEWPTRLYGVLDLLKSLCGRIRVRTRRARANTGRQGSMFEESRPNCGRVWPKSPSILSTLPQLRPNLGRSERSSGHVQSKPPHHGRNRAKPCTHSHRGLRGFGLLPLPLADCADCLPDLALRCMKDRSVDASQPVSAIPLASPTAAAAAAQHPASPCLMWCALLEMCVSFLRQGHANHLRLVSILSDDLRKESMYGAWLCAVGDVRACACRCVV